jgi:hypothetical protein
MTCAFQSGKLSVSCFSITDPCCRPVLARADEDKDEAPLDMVEGMGSGTI